MVWHQLGYILATRDGDSGAMSSSNPAGEILLIDDDELILLLAQQVLQQAGFAVVSTASGQNGIDLYFSRHPDLVLLDLGLPSMDGMTVLTTIRERDPQAKIIVISGYAGTSNTRAAMERGALAFLTKPFHPELMLEKVRDTIFA